MHYSQVVRALTPGLLLLTPLIAAAQVSPALDRATVTVTRPDATAAVRGRVWLTLPGQEALDREAAALYDPSSSSYHRFLTWDSLAPYLPTTAQARAVEAELAAHDLVVTNVDTHNLSVSFSGRAAAFETAFHTTMEIHSLANGKRVSAFAVAPALGNSASGLVHAVTGVGLTAEEPAIVAPTDPITGHQIGIESLEQATAEAATNTGAPYYCFFVPGAALLGTPGQAQPVALFRGPLYSARLNDGKLQSVKNCSYTPAQFFYQTGLDVIHAAGYTGTGQTIAVLEQVGSPTLVSDVQAFDRLYSLPPANLQIINLTTGNPVSVAVNETTLDVEWAHAVAPDAKIVVVDANPNELVDALAYVVNGRLADIVSISYGATERFASPDLVQAWNEEMELASCLHINVDVASGDYGDRVADEGAPDVNVPADSPFATAVGGLTIAYEPETDTLLKTGWGNNLTLIGTHGVPLATPEPIPHGGNKFGSGGGVSTIFPLPGYQAALGGGGRHIPDVSDIADPHTGLRIVVTDPACSSEPCVEDEGGTSLSAPVFSGKWALLSQLHGAPLGQAAPLIAWFAHTPAIEDIGPPPSAAVIGLVLSTSGPRFYSAGQLATPETQQPFVSALWQQEESGNDYVISFGTDSSLAVTPGYDLATGWGEINLKNLFWQIPYLMSEP